MPERGSGYGYGAGQVAALPRFDLDEMMAYYGAVRKTTLEYLGRVTAEELDRVPHSGGEPGYIIGRMFSHLIVEEAEHVGQIAYLRGLQRGLER